jgi:hypothetical protein
MQEPAHKEENHELVSPDSIYSGHSSSQLLDARFSGCRCYLDYLLIRRTLKHAANSSTDHDGGKRRSVRLVANTRVRGRGKCPVHRLLHSVENNHPDRSQHGRPDAGG